MIYIVTRKSDQTEVYRYASTAPVEWAGMGFDTHAHTPLAEDSPVTDAPVIAMTWTKLEYLRRFTQDERIAIRAAAKSVPQLEDYLALMELAGEVRSDDPDIVTALAMLEAGGLIGTGRADQILGVV
jgi:hypothetical protein